MKQISISAAKIAELVHGRISGDPDRIITSVSGIKEAGPDQLTFIANKKYEHQLESAKAGIILVCPDLANAPADNRTIIICDHVDYAFSQVIAIFAEEAPKQEPGIHPSAVIFPGVKLGNNVSVGANTVIDANTQIGDNTVIGAGCYIGQECRIGADCLIDPNVTILFRTVIGNKVILHPGVVLGGDGFGFVPGPQGLVKVPQTGFVQIDDDVEIGANTTVDRARFGRTWIKRNAKIDNLVMVAHNVVVGESSILIAQCGIAGSAELGRGVILAAKSGVNGHITLGDGVQVAATSSVAKSLPAGAIALGTPAESQREFMSRHILPKRMSKAEEKIKALEAKIAALTAEMEK